MKRNERKARDAEIIAQMEEALKEQKTENEETVMVTETEQEPPKTETPQFHCRKCNTLMKNGKCPACGYSDYVPMDAKTQKKIRLILTGVCVVVFLIIFLATR